MGLKLRSDAVQRHFAEADDTAIEVTLQRIINEKDPTVHRAAIWELFSPSGDWDLYEKLSEIGGQKGIMTYFQGILDRFNEVAGDFEAALEGDLERIQDLYGAPIICLRSGDWAGTAAAMHEILLNEIYEVFGVTEDTLPFGEATAFSLQKVVTEEILFPLSMIEYLAYSDCLTEKMGEELLENHLVFLLTLLFSAQAHLDLQEGHDRLKIFSGDSY